MVDIDLEKDNIREMINNAIDTAFNQGNVEKIQEYFHSGFLLFRIKDINWKLPLCMNFLIL